MQKKMTSLRTSFALASALFASTTAFAQAIEVSNEAQLGVNARRMWPCLLVTCFFDIKGLKIITWIVHIYVARLTERCIIILFNNKTYFYYNNKT